MVSSPVPVTLTFTWTFNNSKHLDLHILMLIKFYGMEMRLRSETIRVIFRAGTTNALTSGICSLLWYQHIHGFEYHELEERGPALSVSSTMHWPCTIDAYNVGFFTKSSTGTKSTVLKESYRLKQTINCIHQDYQKIVHVWKMLTVISLIFLCLQIFSR